MPGQYAAEDRPVFCGQCGMQNARVVKFCQNCGSRMQ
jgi:primosomal protein N'